MKPKQITLLLTLTAFALRIFGLSFQPLWGDEGWSVYFAVMPLPQMVSLTALDIHPPLYYALLRGWFALPGVGAESARLLSAMIGALMVPAMYALGQRLVPAPIRRGQILEFRRGNHPLPQRRGNFWSGVAVAAVTAFAPMAIYYSQEVRIYGLVTLLGVLSTLYFVRALQGAAYGAGGMGGVPPLPSPRHTRQMIPSGITGEKSAIWGYVIFTTLALYTMYYAAFIVVFQIVYLVICHSSFVGNRRSAVSGQQSAIKTLLFKALPAIALLYLPWILYAGGKLLNYVQNKTDIEGYVSLGPLKFITGYLLAFSLGHPSEKLQPYAIAAGLVFALIALFGAWHLRMGERANGRINNIHPFANSPIRPFALIALYLLVPLALGWLINLLSPFTPPYFQRTLLIAAPAWWLLIGAGLVWLWRIKRAVALSAGGLLLTINLIGLADFYTFPRYQNEDYRLLLREVAARATPDDALLASYQWQLGYYHAYLPNPHPQFYPVPAWGEVWGTDSAAMARDLRELLATRKVWFPAHQASGHIWEDQAEAMMAELGYPALLKWYNPATRLSLVAPDAPVEAGSSVNFEQTLQAQVNLPATRNFESGRGIIPLEIIWTALQDPQEDYLITLKLVDDQGEIWAKRDAHPRAGQFHFNKMRAGEQLTDRHGLLISAGTPPGAYSLRLTLSEPATDRPLDALDKAGQAQGAEAILASITVEPPALPVGVDALARQVSLDVPFEEQLKLTGYSIGADTLKTGETLPVNLFWQSLGDNPPDLIMFTQLQDEQGNALALTERPPIYPSANWQNGTLLRDLHRLKIPATLPGGTYKLAAGVLREDKTRLQPPRGDQVVLGQITVQERPHSFDPPSPAHPTAIDFDGASLIGYDLEPQTVEAGHPLTLTLYWRGETGFDESWAVFAHLLDASGRLWAQRDQLPGNGEFPTGSWIAGEYIRDTRQISIPADTPPGAYRLEVGLYNPNTFKRVPVIGGGDAVILDASITIR